MRLSPGDEVRVILVKHDAVDVEYPAKVHFDDGNHLTVHAAWPWESSAELGFATFGPGDLFTEHYWRDRWFSVKEVRAADGTRKGWYCDVAEPAVIGADEVRLVDLDLDVWVGAAGEPVVLDEDEFAASPWLSAAQRAGACEGLHALLRMLEERRDAFAALS